MNTFIVLLPQKQENTLGSNNMNINNTAFKLQQTFSNNTNQESKCCYSILIVEDDEDLLQFISKRLEYQYTIYKTTNGTEAIKVLQKKLINLVISDIMMPEMDGFELCCKIKKDTEFSHIPVILLTAKTNVQSKITGLECGADAYIEKSIFNRALTSSNS